MWLRYRADRRTLAIVALYFALVAAGFLVRSSSPWLHLPLVAATCVVSFLCAVVTHNTVHCPVFVTRTSNRAFRVVLTLAYGHPVSAYVPGHNLSHHRWTQSRRDVMRTSKLRWRWNFLNQLLFFHTVSGAIFRAELRYTRACLTANPRQFRQLILEWSAFGVFVVALAALDWRRFLLYVVVPHAYAAWGIVGINFVQHDGCDATHPYNHSRNFVGRGVNWIAFNNGFHGIHHMHPGLHWSHLPEAHARRLHPFLDPNLELDNFPKYLWKAFGWPGVRLTYDGRPVSLRDEGPDEDWVHAAAMESAHDADFALHDESLDHGTQAGLD